MRGAVFVGVDRDLELTDVEPVRPGPSDVVVSVGATGVCHSDLSVVNGARPFPAPALLGHEAAGTVVEVGADVRLVRVGDRVVTSFIPACGRCFWCLRGQSNLCQLAADVVTVPRATLPDGRAATGFLGLGTFAEQMTVHEASLVPVRSDLPDEQLALLGCGVTTGVCAVLRSARVEAGDTVAVLGCGGVGQAVVQGARLAGAARVVAVDPVGWKREVALSLGATDALDPTTDDVRGAVLAATGGRGVDHAFEAAGLPAVTQQALTLTRRGGAVIMLGMPAFDATLQIPALPLFAEGKRVVAGKFGDAQVRRDVQRLIDLAETGRLDLAALVTRRVGLADVNEALRAMAGGEVIRSVIV
ncbi:Zn-dependent alcohol dehydrogenase [Micromonospora sp. WMMD882]|uniref:Zn-dependent alcohol dehydrogenase n=1 Tax=Micromonospora sp. WMMD882 TaxID=3015151 RepID=UPI00248D2786|nr:Zn-dependent alcohol dehydrogenase [Micromonospora sp. WMMD882]WBB80321.1 Zn-dependent alcohol dehydrogenase [Micromonospora sp. WMMD882]